MGWKLINKPHTMKVTKALAMEFAEMEPAPHDRQLSERRLQVYQRLLAQGLFRPVTWARAVCPETNGIYRVNGKHTSVMLSRCDPMPGFYVVVEDYECDSLEDVSRLYATFDSSLQSRNANDIYGSFAATVPEFNECSGRTISLAASGMSLSKWGIRYNTEHQPAERAELLLEDPEFVMWLDGLFTSKKEASESNQVGTRHIQRTAVVAAMKDAWDKSSKAASEFWTLVRDETGKTPSLPDRVLARYLLTVGVDTGNGTRSRTKRASPREIYVKCLHAWNAWRKGETTRLSYFADAEIPKAR